MPDDFDFTPPTPYGEGPLSLTGPAARLSGAQSALATTLREIARIEADLLRMGNSPPPGLSSERVTDWNTQHSTLLTQLRSMTQNYDDAVKQMPAAEFARMPAIPILFEDGRETGQYIDPSNPKGARITDPNQINATDRERFHQQTLNRGATAAEGAANRANAQSLSGQQTQRQREADAVKLAIAGLEEARANRESVIKMIALDLENQTITQKYAAQQTDLAIQREKTAVDLLTTGVNNLNQAGIAELRSWDGLQKIGQETHDKVNELVRGREKDLIASDDNSFRVRAEQQNNVRGNATRMAEAAAKLYGESLSRTLYAPQEWWDTYQKGMEAISRGRTLPQNWLQGMQAPVTGTPDPQFLQKTVTSFMPAGSGSTLANPYGPDVTRTQNPRLGPGGSLDLDRPFSRFQPDMASRPTRLDDASEYSTALLGAGAERLDTRAATPQVPANRINGQVPDLGLGLTPPPTASPFAADEFITPTMEDEPITPPSVAPIDMMGSEPAPAMFEPEPEEAAFDTPQMDYTPYIQAFVLPLDQAANLPDSYVSHYGADIAGVMAGLSVRDVLNYGWADEGYQYDLEDYDNQLQDQLDMLMSDSGVFA